MARKTSKFMLGLFVTSGVLIGVVFVIWVGAGKYFEKGAVYATYFDESVQGLQVDSGVKYRGVDVGRVMKIRVAPDNRLVEVIMKIRLKGVIEEDIVAQLKSAGITGIVFIELDRREGKEPLLGPKLTFATEYPVIASRPSDIKQIMAGLTNIYERIQSIDFEGISNQIKGTAKSVDRFFSNPDIAKMIHHLESTAASLDRTMQKVDGIMAGGKVDQIVMDAQRGLTETRQLLAALKEELKSMKLAEKSEKAGRLADRLDRLTRNLDHRSARAASDMETLLRSLQRNSEKLGRILERLQHKPSDLIFSEPSPQDDIR